MEAGRPTNENATLSATTASRPDLPTQPATWSEYDAAIQLVRDNNRQCSDFFLVSTRKGFLDGVLVTVGFKSPAGQDFVNFVYQTRHDRELFRNEGQAVDAVTRRGNSRSMFRDLLDPDLVPGIIALVIIVLIAALVIIHPAEPKIPDVLSSGLALILGFYFGRKST